MALSATRQNGSTPRVEYAAATTTGGRRMVNEDTFGVFEDATAFAVADGCGGVSSGDHAAHSVLASFAHVLAGKRGAAGFPIMADPLGLAVLRANADVYRESLADPTRRGQAAAVCALRVSPGWVSVAHVGDCRVGRYRPSGFAWLTEDHSLVAEMRRSGAAADELDRVADTHPTVITRAVGVRDHVAVELSYHPAQPGDLYLLCSDGLSRQVDHARLAELLGGPAANLDERCTALLEAAESAGGSDNATVVLVRLAGG